MTTLALQIMVVLAILAIIFGIAALMVKSQGPKRALKFALTLDLLGLVINILLSLAPSFLYPSAPNILFTKNTDGTQATVSITCDNEFLEIYYAIDEEAETAMVLYTGPFVVKEACTIMARGKWGPFMSELGIREYNPKSLEKTKITMTCKSLSLVTGETFSMQIQIDPEPTYPQELLWSSQNENIVTVDANGLVTAVNPGSASIFVSTPECSAECVVTVLMPASVQTPIIQPPTVSEIEITQAPDTLSYNDSVLFAATVTPYDAVDKTVYWSTSNPSVAVVNEDTGLVSVLGFGEVTITARAGNAKDARTYYIMPPWEGLNCDILFLNVGNFEQLTLYPADYLPQDIRWFSDNETVAVVHPDGSVYAVGTGECTVYAIVHGLEFTCQVRVIEMEDSIAEEISIIQPPDLFVGEEYWAGAYVYPESSNQHIIWGSSDPNVVEVTQDGLLHAINPGVAYIFAYSVIDPNIFDEVPIQVFEQNYMPEIFTDGFEVLFVYPEDIVEIWFEVNAQTCTGELLMLAQLGNDSDSYCDLVLLENENDYHTVYPFIPAEIGMQSGKEYPCTFSFFYEGILLITYTVHIVIL